LMPTFQRVKRKSFLETLDLVTSLYRIQELVPARF